LELLVLSRTSVLLLARLALSLVAVLSICGVYALVTGRSPLSGLARTPPEFRLHFDREREEAAARNPGEYRVHVDPRVRYTLRTNSKLAFVDAAVNTDALGIRVRAGPPPLPQARTIVILGDSVAFGTGMTDDACIAQRLEDELAAARGITGPRDVVCRTVAVPGWNWTNEFSFLEDHFDRLRPWIVLYFPISNDLTDTDDVLETGHRRVAVDVTQPDPLLPVSLGRTQQLLSSYWPRVQKGLLELTDREIGPVVLNVDLGGESTRRYDAMAKGIAQLARDLERRGVRFASFDLEESGFTHALARRLARMEPQFPRIPLLDKVTTQDRLPTDPHPNDTVNRVLAHWIAQELVLNLHWVDGRLPADVVPQAYLGRRGARHGSEEESALADQARAGERAYLRDVIDPSRGHGVQQVYGGLSPAATVGARLLAALPRRRGFLEVELAPLEGRTNLYPMKIEVEVDGGRVGEIVIGDGRSDAPVLARFRLDLPVSTRADGVSDDTFDVRLVPERFAVVEELGGFELASCRLVRLARLDR
jgi:hypothetical protein